MQISSDHASILDESMKASSCEIDGSCCGPDSECCIQGAVFREAIDRDFPEVIQLLTSNKLPVAGVHENLAGFIVAEKKDRVIGSAALERYANFGLLRSVAVSEELKGQGLGNHLVNEVLQRARVDGVKEVFLLTTSAENYFPRFGFDPISRNDLPDALNQSAELRGACPDSAIVMRLKL